MHEYKPTASQYMEFDRVIALFLKMYWHDLCKRICRQARKSSQIQMR